jgi:hypothetical protein
MAIALVLGQENSAKKQDENEDEGEGELPKQERGKSEEIERVEAKPIRRQKPDPKNTFSRNNNGDRKPTSKRDPRRRELQNRAKKERKDLMKCGEDSKSAECLKHVLKKYDTNRDGKIGREEMNTGSKRIATEYQRSTNTLRAQNPERQKIQANAKKERSDLVKCIQNPTKCKRNIKEKYDSNGDGKIDEDEKNKGSRRIATEYKKKFKSLRPSSKRTSTRGTRTREEDITNRLKTLKKFKKTLAACSENPRGKGCARALSQADRDKDGTLSSEEREKAEKMIDTAYDRLKVSRRASKRRPKKIQ